MFFGREEIRWDNRIDKATPVLQHRFGGFTREKKYKWDIFGFFDKIDWQWSEWKDVPLNEKGELK